MKARKIFITILIISIATLGCTPLAVKNMEHPIEDLTINPNPLPSQTQEVEITPRPETEATATETETETPVVQTTVTDNFIYLPVVMVSDTGTTDVADIYPVETADPMVMYPPEHTPTGPEDPVTTPEPGHEHVWVPVYQTIEHPAEYREECRPGPEIKIKTCKVTTFTINERPDLGPWTTDTCLHSQAEAEAIYNAAKAAQLECTLAGTCPGGMTISSYEYSIWRPGPEVCEDVLVKEAWTEQILLYWECPCGKRKYP